MALTLTSDSRIATHGLRRRTLSQQIEIGAVTLTFVVVLLACVVSLIYLAHANRVATRGYIIKKLEMEKTELVTENEIWRQQVSEAKSLTAVQTSDAVTRMAKIKDATYLRTDIAVAKK